MEKKADTSGAVDMVGADEVEAVAKKDRVDGSMKNVTNAKGAAVSWSTADAVSGTHGGHGKWEHAGHGGHGGRRGHHGHHGGAPAEELDANGQPIAGSVDANEMGMNAPPPVDANGFPIAQPTAMPVDYSSQPYSTQPMDYSAAPQPTDGSATSSDPLIAQLTSTNPDVAQVLTDAQTQMTPQGYSALSQLMQQNLSTGSDGTTALANSIGQLQQLGGQGLAPDVAALQTVVQNDAPNLVSALSSTTTGTDSSLGTTATTDGSTGATTLDASGAPATQSFDASGAPITQSFDASGAPSADTTLAQISQADPTMGQFIGALQQAGMSQSTYQSIESTVAQNLANGTDDNTSLQQVVQTLQQNPNLQQDYQVFQQVLGSFQQPSTGDTSTATTDATAPTSSTYDPSSYASTGYSTPTSAAV